MFYFSFNIVGKIVKKKSNVLQSLQREFNMDSQYIFACKHLDES